MMKNQLTHAARTAGANAVNKKLTSGLVGWVEQQSGAPLPAFLHTEQGQTLLSLVVPPLLHYLATEMMPANAQSAKVARLAELANEGALNEVAIQLFGHLTGLVEHLAGLADETPVPAATNTAG